MSIEAHGIRKKFGAYTALDGVDLHAPQGKLVALLGPSGSGKTTLLRVIAGLEFPDPGSGRVLFHGEDVTDVPAGKRKVGFVFQHYALFKHMSVFENVAFGLRVRGRGERPSSASISERVHRLLEHLPDGVSEIYFHPATHRDAMLTRLMPEYEHTAELATLLDRGLRDQLRTA